ncbi:MAG: Ca2+/Na+ antiporter [Chlamydiales bacterium]|jgi:Ca2+/Na+ antiporter
MAALIMIASAGAIILFAKFGLLRGIDHIAAAMHWSPKARGQATGYATSVPELVCLVAAGLAGVWEAGLWNIASSNIINAVLMLIAVLYFKQVGELFNRRFLDEVLFAALAIAVPIVLMSLGMATQWYLVPILLGFFFVYRVVDKRVNPSGADPTSAEEAVGSLPVGLILALTALVAIGVSGMFLGSATAEVVQQLGVHPAIAGWILGLVTSIPEMVSFFAVYSTAAREDKLHGLEDTQEALDNLTGSNMANVGIVYPVGLLVFLLSAAILGA